MPSYTSMHDRVNVNILAQSEANELLSLDPWCMCPLAYSQNSSLRFMLLFFLFPLEKWMDIRYLLWFIVIGFCFVFRCGIT